MLCVPLAAECAMVIHRRIEQGAAKDNAKMSRLMSGLFTTVAMGAMGFACGTFALAVLPEPEAPFTEPQRAPKIEPVVVSARPVPEQWPAVFGVIPEAAPEPEPEPEPVVEAPPERNNTYLLTGVIAGEGIQGFAMLRENDRGLVVREGDVLVGGETVTAIDEQGVWIEFDGVRELIPVPETDFGTMISVETPEPEAAPSLASEITIPVEALTRASLEELLTASARMEPLETGMQLTSIREGMLFDQIGLKAGDTITLVNGAPLQGPDILATTPEDSLLSGVFELEILRDGARQTIKVTLEQI